MEDLARAVDISCGDSGEISLNENRILGMQGGLRSLFRKKWKNRALFISVGDNLFEKKGKRSG